jgi:hypothetical protein
MSMDSFSSGIIDMAERASCERAAWEMLFSDAGDGGAVDVAIRPLLKGPVSEIPLATDIEIVCGNCSGDGDRPRSTYATKRGECSECGGRSYITADEFWRAVFLMAELGAIATTNQMPQAELEAEVTDSVAGEADGE